MTAQWLGIGATDRTVPKHGRAPSENEDSFDGNRARGRYAVSDGASTAARSEVWSQILVDVFVQQQIDPLCADELHELRDRWWRQVCGGGSLPWFAQTKLLEGSAATFLGITFESGRFRARALGDSCLLHVRDDALLVAGPLGRSAQFNRTPPLVYTHPSMELDEEAVWTEKGEYQPGDTFVLATDAAAKHLLRRYEQDGAVPPVPKTVEKFHRWVHDQRAAGQLDNDDTTVCVIRT